jgi:hypothetical protein
MAVWFRMSLLLFAGFLPFGQKPLQENPGAVSSEMPDPLRPRTVSEDTSNNHSLRFREVENRAFQVGERLEYNIRYGSLTAGKARLSIPETVRVNGRSCYHFVSEAWTNPFFSKFYKVEDRVRSFTDSAGMFSWRMEKKQQEGRYRDERTVDFDHLAGLAIATKKDKRDTTRIPPFVLDMLSAVYYVRTQELAAGDSVLFDNYDNGKIYPLKIIIHRKEKIRTAAGKFECFVVEPFMQTPAFFQQRGRVIVHMTADERKIPVLITSQLYLKGFDLGNIVAELEKMEGVMGQK